MSTRLKRFAVGLAATTLIAGFGAFAAGPAQAATTTCSAVTVVFARGSGESAGLGMVGTPFVSSLTGDLTGKTVSSYAVNYAASYDQSSAGAGATDMTNYVVKTAAACPTTKFVLGGYSQGASVTDIALGATTALGTGSVIPTSLAPRISAIVVFGNPLALLGGHLTSSTLYGSKSDEFCNSGDPVCGSGINIFAHLLYGFDGSTTKGATFAAGKVNG